MTAWQSTGGRTSGTPHWSDTRLFDLVARIASGTARLRWRGLPPLGSLDALTDGIFVMRARDGRVVYANRTARELVLMASAHRSINRVDQTPFELTTPEGVVVPLPRTPALRAARGETVIDEICVLTDQEHGQPERWMAITAVPITSPLTRRVSSVVCRMRDCTAERESVEHQLELGRRRHELVVETMALTDPLTQLGNRAQVTRWAHEIGAQPRTGVTALLLIDLDAFKTFNDSLGHGAGDTLLLEVADRLRALRRPGLRVARLGGDEFVVLAEDLSDQQAAEQLAAELVRDLSITYHSASGMQVLTTVSAGIALAGPDQPVVADELLRTADLALYAAKKGGRRRWVVGDAVLVEEVQARLVTEQVVRRAVESGALVLYLQPIVDLTTSGTVGYEALVRLLTTSGELLSPEHFLGIASETGLITDIDRWMIHEAARIVARHPELVASGRKICVNVSSRTFASPDYPSVVREALSRNGIDGSSLVLEITEHSLLHDEPQIHEAITAVNEAGLEIAVDDFGTGYSALAYLRLFAVHRLKLDISFVAALADADGVAASTVRAIISVAHAHGLVVTAEGVEHRWQAELLRAMGCDHAQGYWFGHPVPA